MRFPQTFRPNKDLDGKIKELLSPKPLVYDPNGVDDLLDVGEEFLGKKCGNYKETAEYVVKNFNDIMLITDYHSTFTTQEYGKKPDYILLMPNSWKIEQNRDPYFNIPYIVYDSEIFKTVIDNNEVIFIIRDASSYNLDNKISSYVNRKEPYIYKY